MCDIISRTMWFQGLKFTKCFLALLSAMFVVTVWRNRPGERVTKYMHQILDTHMELDNPYPGVWINPPGDIYYRIGMYVKEIENVRMSILSKRQNATWNDIADESQVVVVDPNFAYYIHNISHHNTTSMVFLKWRGVNNPSWSSLLDKSNLPVQQYYQWVADQKLCDFATDKAFVDYRWAYWPKCVTNKWKIFKPSSLQVAMLNTREWVAKLYIEGYNFPTDRPPPYVTHLTIMQDAVISEKGSVVSGNLKIFPSSCQRKEWQIHPKDYHHAPIYPEVLSIAQRWGMMYYHGNIESLPRIAPYLDFIKRNPNIKVHCGELHTDFALRMLGMLGISADRIVKGVVRAKVVYLTEGTTCGFVQVPNIQLMSGLYRKYIQTLSKRKRNLVIVIRRTKGRGFKEAHLIESKVKNLTEKHKLEFAIYSDNPAPSLVQSMTLFNRAVMVIGPHGAGFFNIIFSEPGTYVIEAVLSIPHVAMCYQRLAYALGLRYYGTIGPGYEHIEVDVKNIEDIVETYMPHAATFH